MKRKKGSSNSRLVMLVVLAAAIGWLIFVAPARSTHNKLVQQLAAQPKPLASPKVSADTQTLQAGPIALAAPSAATLRSFVYVAAHQTGVAVIQYAPKALPSKLTNAKVVASGSAADDVAFLARLAGNVKFTASGQLRARGPLYVLSSVTIGTVPLPSGPAAAKTVTATISASG